VEESPSVSPPPGPETGLEPLDHLRGVAGLRLGIMGGAFDPIHLGHLRTAEEAREQFALDEVVFIPTGKPPHKARTLSPAEARYLMVTLATASNPHFWVSRIEIDRPGLDYTVDTMVQIRGMLRADAHLFFVTGADAVLDILTWKEPERLLEICTLIAATRPGYGLDRLRQVLDGLPHAEKVLVMEIPALAISSSLIRLRAAEGRGMRYLVPDGVAAFAEKAVLYRERDASDE